MSASGAAMHNGGSRINQALTRLLKWVDALSPSQRSISLVALASLLLLMHLGWTRASSYIVGSSAAIALTDSFEASEGIPATIPAAITRGDQDVRDKRATITQLARAIDSLTRVGTPEAQAVAASTRVAMRGRQADLTEYESELANAKRSHARLVAGLVEAEHEWRMYILAGWVSRVFLSVIMVATVALGGLIVFRWGIARP